MKYAEVAGRILFGEPVLDNAIRGHFIEALVLDALNKEDGRRNSPTRWHHVGRGWGPWDLQRGTAQEGNRVRVQVRAGAFKQVWAPRPKTRYEYDLGWKEYEKLPEYFATDFPSGLIGECELTGYRCDLFLLAWHGPNPITGESEKPESQSDPNNYDYFILSAAEFLNATESPLRRLPVRRVFERNYQQVNYAELPKALNEACDGFLAVRAPTAA